MQRDENESHATDDAEERSDGAAQEFTSTADHYFITSAHAELVQRQTSRYRLPRLVGGAELETPAANQRTLDVSCRGRSAGSHDHVGQWHVGRKREITRVRDFAEYRYARKRDDFDLFRLHVLENLASHFVFYFGAKDTDE